jgi:hypothetical protein
MRREAFVPIDTELAEATATQQQAVLAEFPVATYLLPPRVGGPMVGSLVQCALRLSGSRSRPARRSSCAGVGRGAVSTIW